MDGVREGGNARPRPGSRRGKGRAAPLLGKLCNLCRPPSNGAERDPGGALDSCHRGLLVQCRDQVLVGAICEVLAVQELAQFGRRKGGWPLEDPVDAKTDVEELWPTGRGDGLRQHAHVVLKGRPAALHVWQGC
eukprot:scaffold281874_cov24-Tisochrysis_lutea.AAC.3